MTSLALYRRYRPQRFEDVLGQEHVTETLQAAIKEDRVGHAYLFSGSRGTGKTTTARILAKALNCETGPTPTPCNTCDACIGITDGRSLDVIEIDAASHGGVDDVRELRENAVLAPAAGRKKIYIVDEAHMVSTAGWNAFLKTVEEPPAHVVFVFATTEPHKVLPTIASRCQRFDFRRVSSQTIAEHLAKIAKDEGIEADEGALQLIARAAEGGVRDAMSTLDQLAAAGSITAADAARLVGGAGADLLFELADSLAASDTGAGVHLVARLVESGQDLRVFARGLLEHLRALLISKHVPEPGALIDANDETRARYAAQADSFGAGRLVHLLRLVTDALADMREQTSPRLALELAIVRATMAEVDDTSVAAIARIERLERRLDVSGPPGAPAPSGAPTAPAASGAPTPSAASGASAPSGAPAARADQGPPSAPTASAPSGAPAARADQGPPSAASSPERSPARGTQPAPDGTKQKKSSARKTSTKRAQEPNPTPAQTHETPGGGQTPGGSSQASTHALDVELIRRSWNLVLEGVRKTSRSLHALLADAAVGSFGDGVLMLEARYGFHAEQLAEPKNARVIAGAIQEVLGAAPMIRAVVRDAPAEDEPADEGPSDPLDIVKAGFGDDVIEE